MSVVAERINLSPGFKAPVADSQKVFRAVLNAMSEPGSVHGVQARPAAPPGLTSATTAICLTLLDFETPVWLDAEFDGDACRAYLKFHCGCALVADRNEARFALLAGGPAVPCFTDFHLGSEDYPNESVTLIIQVESLDGGEVVTLNGPGIKDHRTFGPIGLSIGFWKQRRELEVLFPEGLDLIFSSDNSLAALPRSTRVEF